MKDNKHVLTRRDFVRGSIGAAIGTSIFGLRWTTAEAKTIHPSLVTVVRNKNALDTLKTVNRGTLEKMLAQTLIMFTGRNNTKDAWLSLIKPDDMIGLVPADYLNRTHDEIVDAVKNSLIDAGIPGNRIIFAQGSPRLPEKCTALIALPALKTHRLTGIGTVLKGYIMFSGSPSSYHGAGSSKLGEIWNLPFIKGKTKLILVDALYPQCDKGPQPDPRYQWAYNGLIAGTDPVAVETVGSKIIEGKRKAMRGEPWPLSPPPICVEAADKVYGLGTSKMKKIKIEHYGWKKGLFL